MASHLEPIDVPTVAPRRVGQAPSASPRTVLSADGTRIGFRTVGHGPGLVVVHGAMESAASHLELAEALADQFTVHLLDRRGRGLSGPYAAGHSIDRDVEDVAAVLTATGSEALFGVSSGGVIALQAALQLPAIRRVAIYEPALVDDPGSFARSLSRYDREIEAGKVADALVTAMRISRMGPRIFSLIPMPILTRLTASMLAKENRSATADTVTMGRLAPTLHHDFSAILDASERIDAFRDIAGTVLLLGGTKSPAYLRRALARLEGVLADARRVELAGLGHGGSGNAALGGRPSIVAAELRTFFS